jgi:uncharacterized membrane protein YphA (DoxX/SURF4 family)
MPLDDREQRILEEIEILSLIGGTALMLGFFTRSTIVALIGFVVMVVSVAWIVSIVRRRSGAGLGVAGTLVSRLQRRWRRPG